MRLGEATQFTIGTKDLVSSLKLYEKLGFQKIAGSEKPNPWAQISDGTLLLLLNQDGMDYFTLTYFTIDAWEKMILMDELNIRFIHRSMKEDQVAQGIFRSPGGLNITLMGHDPEQIPKAKGKTLKDIERGELKDPSAYPNQCIGAFGELAIPVDNVNGSFEFWKKFDFNALTLNEEPYPWAIISDGLSLLGLHQTEHFKKPCITYFAPDMELRIAKLKENGINSFVGSDADNKGIKNAALQTPEGQQIFLFTV